jgi:hypothetical protein
MQACSVVCSLSALSEKLLNELTVSLCLATLYVYSHEWAVRSMHCFCTILQMLVQCIEVNGCQLVQFPVLDLHCTFNIWDRFSWPPNWNFYRWKSEKSGAMSTSILVSIRFLSGSSQGYRTPTLSGQLCGEKNNTCYHLWFILNFMENVSALTSAHKENHRYIVLNHCLLQALPAHFLNAWDLFCHIWIWIPSGLPPISLSRMTPSAHFDSSDWSGNCWLTNF